MAEDDYGKAGREAGKRGSMVDFNSLQTAKNKCDEENKLLGEPIQPASRTTKENECRKTWERDCSTGKKVS